VTASRSPLTAGQLEQIRKELVVALEKLERSMLVTSEALRPVELDQTTVGRLSRIDNLQNQGLARNLQERERLKHAIITEALHRMEAGTFGIC
jgi:DnaK suppressor protein